MSSPSRNILEGTKIPQVNCLFPNCKNVEILYGRKVWENIDTPFKSHELVEKIVIEFLGHVSNKEGSVSPQEKIDYFLIILGIIVDRGHHYIICTYCLEPPSDNSTYM